MITAWTFVMSTGGRVISAALWMRVANLPQWACIYAIGDDWQQTEIFHESDETFNPVPSAPSPLGNVSLLKPTEVRHEN